MSIMCSQGGEDREPFIHHEELCLFSSSPSFHPPSRRLHSYGASEAHSPSPSPANITKYLLRRQDKRLLAPNCAQLSRRRKRWDRERKGAKARKGGKSDREDEIGQEGRREEMKDVFVQYHRLTYLSYLLPSRTICPLVTEEGWEDGEAKCKCMEGTERVAHCLTQKTHA